MRDRCALPVQKIDIILIISIEFTISMTREARDRGSAGGGSLEQAGQPAFTATSLTSIDGNPANRLMVVYRTRGCAYAATGHGCTMCDFAHYAVPGITEVNIQQQHKGTLERLGTGKFPHFDLLTLGNFFNDAEISPSLREYLLTPLAGIPQLKRVLVESRRRYVTLEKLKECKQYLRLNQTLEYALGYEAQDEKIRNGVLNKGVSEQDLGDAMVLCKDAGVDFAAYILIKPQTLTEAQGIEEAVKSAVHVLEKAEEYGIKARILFEPVFVTEGTKLEELFQQDQYAPPRLWSVAEVLIKVTEEMGSDRTCGKLFVGLSDENLSKERMASNCPSCNNRVKEAIAAYNGDQDHLKLISLDCECKQVWRNHIQE